MANKIQEITIWNFKGILWKSEKLNGHHIILVGKNGGGKTSFIDAAVGNIKGINTPLKEGANKGLVRVEVDGYTIEHTFSKKNQKPKLSIYDKSGNLQGAPAALFKDLFGVQDFNIDDFLKLSASKKVEFIKNIVGIDFSKLDEEFKELYSERTFLNRKIKEHDAKMLSIPVVKDCNLIDTNELQKKITDANTNNVNFARIERITLEKGLEIIELEKQIESLRAEIKTKLTEKKSGNDWLEHHGHINTEKLNEELSAAIEHNQNASLYIQYGKERKEGAENVQSVLKVEERMQTIKAIKTEELAAVEMPVKGLTFEGESLYLDGLPFESSQINTARRIIAGLEIQYHLKGEVSIARIEGSLLDKESTAEVLAWADSKDLQLFIEKVDFEGGELEIKIIEN